MHFPDSITFTPVHCRCFCLAPCLKRPIKSITRVQFHRFESTTMNGHSYGNNRNHNNGYSGNEEEQQERTRNGSGLYTNGNNNHHSGSSRSSNNNTYSNLQLLKTEYPILIPYQIDFQTRTIGKHISLTKRYCLWRFGFAHVSYSFCLGLAKVMMGVVIWALVDADADVDVDALLIGSFLLFANSVLEELHSLKTGIHKRCLFMFTPLLIVGYKCLTKISLHCTLPSLWFKLKNSWIPNESVM